MFLIKEVKNTSKLRYLTQKMKKTTTGKNSESASIFFFNVVLIVLFNEFLCLRKGDEISKDTDNSYFFIKSTQN